MFHKCDVCGSRAFSLRTTEECPKCGSPFSPPPRQVEKVSNADRMLELPQRKNSSLGDRLTLDREKLRHNLGIEGRVSIHSSWDELLMDRPLDVPLYLALRGEAFIGVLLARRSIPDPRLLDEIVRSRPPFLLHSKAFLDGGYPVLRMNLYIPDKPADPLCLESPLDVRDGDAQEFFQAVQRSEQIRLILIHEAEPGRVVNLLVVATGLAELLKREIDKLLRALAHTANGEGSFRAASEHMERVFRSATHGIDRRHLVRLSAYEEVDFDELARQALDLMTPYFQSQGREPLAGEKELIDIGWKLHRAGGMEAMLRIFEVVDRESRSRYRQSARMLERIWGGVGDWRG
jgi:ribosomal protein L37E